MKTNSRDNSNRYRVYGEDGVSPTLHSMGGGGLEPHTIEVIGKAYEKENYGDNRNRILGDGGVSPSMTATQYKEPYRIGVNVSEIRTHQAKGCKQGIFVELENGNKVYAVWYEKKQCYIAIRKLTPKECFRLQGFDDEDFEKAKFVNSDSQLYKQAGNAVTVNVIEEIAKRLGNAEIQENQCERKVDV